MRNKEMIRLSIMAIFLTGSALSMAGGFSYDHARVLRAEPITRTVRVSTPRQECWDEQVTYSSNARRDNGVSTVIGAILGGALGNAVGHNSSNKQVGAVVGAVLGGTLGHAHSARKDHPGKQYSKVEERCQVYNDYQEQEKIIGYKVRYEYQGKVYHARTDRDPGDRIRVKVTVAIAD